MLCNAADAFKAFIRSFVFGDTDGFFFFGNEIGSAVAVNGKARLRAQIVLVKVKITASRTSYNERRSLASFRTAGFGRFIFKLRLCNGYGRSFFISARIYNIIDIIE